MKHKGRASTWWRDRKIRNKKDEEGGDAGCYNLTFLLGLIECPRQLMQALSLLFCIFHLHEGFLVCESALFLKGAI